MAVIYRIKRVGWFFYFKLFRINDTPIKIALGFGLGAFVRGCRGSYISYH